MHSSQHQQPYELEFIPGNMGLEEFDAESGETRGPGPTVVASRSAQDFRVFSVVEQYEPCEAALRLTPRPRVDRGDRPVLRLIERLAIAAVLVAIPSGTPVGTEGLPRPSTLTVQTAPTVQAPSPSVEPLPARSALTQVTSDRRQAQHPPATPAAGARTGTASVPPLTASPPQLASLREAFASLNGPFMTFEHCEVRLASTDRAVARCQGTQNNAQPGGAPLSTRRVEWTLDFDRAEQRWLIVDSAAR